LAVVLIPRFPVTPRFREKIAIFVVTIHYIPFFDKAVFRIVAIVTLML
jgi:hypothetical protein